MNIQIVKVCLMNLRNIPTRIRSSLVAVACSAGVVGVLVTVLAMAEGFESALQPSGENDQIVMLKGGATTELVSNISVNNFKKLRQIPEIAKEGDELFISSQLLVVISVPLKDTNTTANLSLRGVDNMAYKINNITVIEGRFAQTGKREVIVGSMAAKQFKGLEIDAVIGSGLNTWTVVGIFESNGGSNGSEIWADVLMVQSAFDRANMFTSVHAKLVSDSSVTMKSVIDVIDKDPELNIIVHKDKEYYATQSQSLVTFIKTIGYSTAVIMTIGAIFASLNTMYASVSARKREIGILRSIGFGNFSISFSIFIESAILTIVGGIIGCILVYVIFHNYSVSTLNMASFSQVAFSFSVTIDTLSEGLKWACLIGMLGGILPALQASRLTTIETLRKAH